MEGQQIDGVLKAQARPVIQRRRRGRIETDIGADARTGQLATQLDLGTAVYVTPVVAGGRMYILADNASLIALD